MELNQERTKDESSSIHTANWSTAGQGQNKKGLRQQIPLIMEVRRVGGGKTKKETIQQTLKAY